MYLIPRENVRANENFTQGNTRKLPQFLKKKMSANVLPPYKHIAVNKICLFLNAELRSCSM